MSDKNYKNHKECRRKISPLARLMSGRDKPDKRGRRRQRRTFFGKGERI